MSLFDDPFWTSSQQQLPIQSAVALARLQFQHRKGGARLERTNTLAPL